MQLDEYQKKAITTEMMRREGPLDANNPAMVAKILGLVGEAGETAEKYKKIVRDKAGKFSDEDVVEIAKELGDVLWYVASLADYLGVSLESIAQTNLDKLQSRQQRGVQAGSGDNR
ncbi:MAG: hypothetical protein QG629_14 [Patescibacteria group bacterium]|nr:nucleoside triphosphate pyrophosphohydrolase family protein [Candidatus Saccharibacteria bacterium]MDQ5962932.1 hypothetical protein [Patescibacteria group bacterium]